MAFTDLPNELICRIYGCLKQEDAFAFRFVCKKLERATFRPFSRRHFRKKGFMITSFSLGTLRRIADHKALAECVQHVWFNPDCFTFVEVTCGGRDSDTEGEEGYSNQRLLSSQQLKAYRHALSDHRMLIETEELRDQLHEIFAQLPNLRTIGMRRSEDYAPYGWSILRDLTGLDPRVLGIIPRDTLFALAAPTKLFVAIIDALPETGARVQRLYTDAIELDNVNPVHLSQDILDSACQHLLYLEVNVYESRMPATYDRSETRSWANQSFIPLQSTSESRGLVRLAAAVPQLRELGLQIFPDRHQSHLIPPRQFEPSSWQDGYPYHAFRNLAEGAHLRNLSRVKLEKFTTTADLIWAFLEPSAHGLISLKLRDIRLLTSETQPRPWQVFFTALSTDCKQLAYILFYHLMYDLGSISFVAEEDETQPLLSATVHHSQGPVGSPSLPENVDSDESDEDEQLDQDLPLFHGGHRTHFAQYDHLTVEARGLDVVQLRIVELGERHWYRRALRSYAMDEDLWHTDTSDEDW